MNNKSLEIRDERREMRDEGLETLDKLIDSLQGQQPMLDDADAFIDSIMDNLPDLEDNSENTSHTTPPSGDGGLILMLRTFSSLAAMLLIGLFIFLNIDNSAKAQQVASNQDQITHKSSYYSDMSKCTTPEEAMKMYADKKQRSINKLISMYNEK